MQLNQALVLKCNHPNLGNIGVKYFVLIIRGKISYGVQWLCNVFLQ